MDETPSSSAPPSALTTMLLWIVTCAIATTAISLAAAHAPPRFRLIGLFAIAFGLLVGWSTVRLAGMLEIHPTAVPVSTLAALLTIIGLIGSTWETLRIEESRHGDLSKERLAQQLIENMKSDTASNESIPIDQSVITGFRWYLARRVRQLGNWTSPWPELFWGMELLAAAASAAGIAIRSVRPGPVQQAPEPQT